MSGLLSSLTIPFRIILPTTDFLPELIPLVRFDHSVSAHYFTSIVKKSIRHSNSMLLVYHLAYLDQRSKSQSSIFSLESKLSHLSFAFTRQPDTNNMFTWNVPHFIAVNDICIALSKDLMTLSFIAVTENSASLPTGNTDQTNLSYFTLLNIGTLKKNKTKHITNKSSLNDFATVITHTGTTLHLSNSSVNNNTDNSVALLEL